MSRSKTNTKWADPYLSEYLETHLVKVPIPLKRGAKPKAPPLAVFRLLTVGEIRKLGAGGLNEFSEIMGSAILAIEGDLKAIDTPLRLESVEGGFTVLEALTLDSMRALVERLLEAQSPTAAEGK